MQKIMDKAQQRESLFSRVVAVLLTVVLASSFINFGAFGAQKAWAAEAISVALTIVDTSDSKNGVIYNKVVEGLTSENTVADMLAKAGFAEASSSEATEGDDSKYFVNWGSPTFRGNKSVEVAKDVWQYWVTMFNGSSASYKSAQVDAKLQDGGHYQYVFTTESAFSYDEFSIQLTILDTSDSEKGVICNRAIQGLTSENTVADMLAKAGFAEASSSEATEGDDSKYFVNWGSPTFRGNKSVEVAKDVWQYWVTMFNGSSAGYKSAQVDAKLQDGGRYQYVFTTDGSFEYSKAVPELNLHSSMIDPLSEYEPEPIDPEPEPEPTPEPSNTYDAQKGAKLLSNLTARFSQGGDWSQLLNDEYPNPVNASAAVALKASGNASMIDASAILSSDRLKGYAEEGPGQLAKFIVVLNAAGVDCTAVEINGSKVNLVEEMEGKLDNASIYDMAWILDAYTYCGYGSNSSSVVELADKVASQQAGDGLWGKDVQTTAEIALAMIPLVGQSNVVSKAVDTALEAVLGTQNPDGGFSPWGSDANTTSAVVCLMAAKGLDPNGQDFATENGSTPMGFLLSAANDDENPTEVYWKPGNEGLVQQASSDAFMALVAYAGFQGAGGAFNVFSAGEKPTPQPAPEPTPAPNQSADEFVAGVHSSSASVLASTGDTTDAAPVAALALCALAAACVAARRVKKD